jgi:uroporphyrinogen decarboxylase
MAALAGESPDRVPFALGFFPQSLYGHADVDEAYGSDVRFVEFDPPPEQDGLMAYLESLPADVHVGSDAQLRTYQEWGYHPEHGDGQARGSRVSSADMVEGLLPDLVDIRRHAAVLGKVRDFHARGLAVAGAPPALGGELFESAYRVRGFERFMGDLLEREELVDHILDRLADMLVQNVAVLAEAGVDILLLDDDVASSHGLIIHPDTWRRFFRPRLARVIGVAREAAPSMRVFYHSDGDFTRLIPELIALGVDVVNPVAPDCMDAAALRRDFGPRLAMWGTVGEAATWDHGAPNQIRTEVRERLDTLGPAGLLLAPAYDLDYAPRANVETFVETILEHG